jgi:hypothetical protein
MKSTKIPTYKKIHVQIYDRVVELVSKSNKLKEVRFISKPRRPKNDVITFQCDDNGFAEALQCYEKGIIHLDPYHFWNIVRHFFMDHEFLIVDDLNY